MLAAFILLVSAAAPLEALTVDPMRDGIALGISAAFAGTSELLVRYAPSLPTTPETSLAGLGPLDTALLFRYSEPGDVASTFLESAAMLTPIALSLAMSPSVVLPDLVAYGESFGLALAAKNVMKYLLPRYRPYTLQGGAEGVNQSEDDQSFPSGHATMAFTAAAFSTYLYIEGLPGSAPLLPFVLSSYALAGLTASYRVLFGMHFLSDVLAGAAVGMICGFVVPALFRP